MIVYIYHIYIIYNYYYIYIIIWIYRTPAAAPRDFHPAWHRITAEHRVAVQLGAGDLIGREPGLAHGAAHALLLRRTVGRRHAGTPGARVVARVAKIQGSGSYLHTRCIVSM